MVSTPVSRVRYNAEAPEVAQLKEVHSAKDEIMMLLTLLPHLCGCFAIIFMGNSRVKGGSGHFFQGQQSYIAAQRRAGATSDVATASTVAFPSDFYTYFTVITPNWSDKNDTGPGRWISVELNVRPLGQMAHGASADPEKVFHPDWEPSSLRN